MEVPPRGGGKFNDYAAFRDRHVHNPNCAGGSHRISEARSPRYYPGTQLPKEPKKWTWRDYKAAAIRRKNNSS